MEFKSYWDKAQSFADFVASSDQHRGLWDGIYRLARLPEWATQAVPMGFEARLLAISEDWCGDASNTIPVLAKWAESTPGLELRVILRDKYPELMDRYLTNGSRSIPIVIVLDRNFAELGYWGPRPTVLQSWVMENKPKLPKAELYPQVRKWYARDRGETTIREVLGVMGLQPPDERVA